MGLGTNVIVLLMVTAYILSLAGYPCAATTILSGFLDGNLSAGNILGNGLTTLLTIAVPVGIIATLVTFPNPYAIFAGITGILLTFFTFPYSIFSEPSMPSEIKILVGGTFAMIYLLALISWFKGGGEL